MRILLDTQIFLWWIMDSPLLSQSARSLTAEGNNELFLSAASGWEIAIKTRLGRLQLPDAPERFVPEQLAQNRILSLPVLMSHALHVANLPDHHNDPFDRLLVAQAQVEDLPILTSDPNIARYDVRIADRDL
ncbi:MAG: type II toxin-antitoxin system VapC family toxin [Chloroflexi bacterium]|nr:type II toxin-antitoxin system VapC family toxin [Chloroflexota bacterium]